MVKLNLPVKSKLKVNLCNDVLINFYYFITIKVFWKICLFTFETTKHSAVIRHTKSEQLTKHLSWLRRCAPLYPRKCVYSSIISLTKPLKTLFHSLLILPVHYLCRLPASQLRLCFNVLHHLFSRCHDCRQANFHEFFFYS